VLRDLSTNEHINAVDAKAPPRAKYDLKCFVSQGTKVLCMVTAHT